jgi:ABC-2 type transport system ATP-binding protein
VEDFVSQHRPTNRERIQLIDAKNLTKTFGTTTAVDNLTFHIEEGEVFGFLGPNGAGKTTTMRMLCCLISTTSGAASISGYDITNPANSLKIRKMIGTVPDNVGLYNELSAWDNLDFYGKLYEVPATLRKQNIERFLKMLELWDKKDVAAGKFSKGMKQKLAIARALVHEPKILFMDEPTANLDPQSAKTVRDFVVELKKQKKTIFLSTHNLDEAQKLCDRIGILKTRLLTIGTPEELKESLWGVKAEFQLEKVDDPLLSALKQRIPNKIEVSGNKLIIVVASIEKENPGIIEAIVASGGRIQLVSQVSPSLEDVYLKIVEQK